MGVGTNILGYNNIEVDNAVSNVIKEGNLSTLELYRGSFFSGKIDRNAPMVRHGKVCKNWWRGKCDSD